MSKLNAAQFCMQAETARSDGVTCIDSMEFVVGPYTGENDVLEVLGNHWCGGPSV